MWKQQWFLIEKNEADINCKWWLGADEKSKNNFINNITHNQRLNPTRHALNSSHSSHFDSNKHLSAAVTRASCNYTTSGSIPIGSVELLHWLMQFVLPNSQSISSEKTAVLPDPKELPPDARTANVFNQLTEGSLTSIGQCCHHGCKAIFDKNRVNIKQVKKNTSRPHKSFQQVMVLRP